jgi:hypothetical protein
MRLPSEAGRFDCMILSHVLEHVRDLKIAVANLAGAVQGSGLAYIELPDAPRYADFVYAPFQDFNTEHINHFSRASLDNLMGAHGFEALGGQTRTMQASADTLAPAFYAIYRSTGKRRALVKDRLLKPAIVKYIDMSARLMSRIDKCIQDALRSSPELIVWGTGQLTLKLLAESSLATARIKAYVDSNPVNQGRQLRGVSILAPADILGLPQPILIATMLHQSEILADMKRLGLANRPILLPPGGPEFFGRW